MSMCIPLDKGRPQAARVIVEPATCFVDQDRHHRRQCTPCTYSSSTIYGVYGVPMSDVVRTDSRERVVLWAAGEIDIKEYTYSPTRYIGT